MGLPANSERGEVALMVAGVDLVICAEIGRLAKLSSETKCASLEELYSRLIGAEVSATLAALRILTVEGDADRALSGVTLADFPACKAAFTTALMHHLRDPAGKAAAAREGAAKTRNPSRSGSG